jgi:outer membrane protein TolC
MDCSMKSIRRPGTSLILALAVSLSVNAQTAPGLEELVQSALQKSHTLANKSLEVESSRIDAMKLREFHLPTVDLSGKYAHLASGINLKTPANSVPEMGIALPAMDDSFTNTANLLTGSLKAEAVLYTGGKVSNLKKALNEKINAQTALLEKDRQEIIGNVSAAYDQIALLTQAGVVLEESKKRLESNSQTANKALQYGLITPYEHQKIEVAQAQLEAKVLHYEGQRNLLLQLLHQYTGIERERLALINQELSPAFPDANGNTFENRPELAALSAGLKAREYQIEAAKSWWKPKVMASTSLGYLNAFDLRLKAKEPFPTGNTLTLNTNKLELVPNFNIGVGFKWDLFDGHKGKREVQQARIELRIAENEKAEAMEKLELNLLRSETSYSVAMAEIKARDKQLASAKSALNLASKEFKTGLIKASELIGAEVDFQSASLDYLQAIYQQRRTVVDLLKATGSLTAQSIR